jgi:tripartite-type tricarboxylate transporter receptor subunit TctC
VAPVKTPAAIVNKLGTTAGQVAKTPEIGGKIKALGGEAVGSSPAEFQKLIARETPRWRKLIQELGMTGSLQ